MTSTNQNGFLEVSAFFIKIYWKLGVKSTFGMIKNIFTSPKKSKREKIPENKIKEIQSETSKNISKDQELKKHKEISTGSNKSLIYEYFRY